MPQPLVVIFHQPPQDGDPPLTGLLARARATLVDRQVRLFGRAGGRVAVLPGRAGDSVGRETFGERLRRLVREERLRRLVREERLGAGATGGGGLVVLGAGAVPLLTLDGARRLLAAAASGAPVALTNNRYSSDVCALGDASVLRGLPPLPSDNALPRWLEERRGVAVAELPGRDRLAIDIDTPLDLALAARIPGVPASLRAYATAEGLAIPNLDALRALAADPRRELLVAGRSGSATLRWLEANVRCRVRFLAEERGLRASSELAIGGPDGSRGDRPGPSRPPRTSLGRLLDVRGPEALAAIAGELADGAILDTRVLLADRLGADEAAWPAPEDRFASDLLRAKAIADPWLRVLTASAAEARIPILLGAHTVVGPGVRWLLGR